MRDRSRGAAIGTSIGLLVYFLLSSLARNDYQLALGICSIMIILHLTLDSMNLQDYPKYKTIVISLLIINSIFMIFTIFMFQEILLPLHQILNISVLRVFLPLLSTLYFYSFTREVIISVNSRKNHDLEDPGDCHFIDCGGREIRKGRRRNNNVKRNSNVRKYTRRRTVRVKRKPIK